MADYEHLVRSSFERVYRAALHVLGDEEDAALVAQLAVLDDWRLRGN